MPDKTVRRWIAASLTLSLAQLAAPGICAENASAATLVAAMAEQIRSGSVVLDGGSGAGAYLQDAASVATVSAAANAASSAWTERYDYDALGRLRKVTFANGAVTSYTLDKAGNRTAVNTTIP